MKRNRPHPLELRPIAGYSRRVHATAFYRAVETIANLDGLSAAEATRRAMGELDAGQLRLRVVNGFAAYQVVA